MSRRAHIFILHYFSILSSLGRIFFFAKFLRIFWFLTAIEYADTSNYYWPLLSTNKYSLDDETSYAGPIGYQLPDNDTSGPFGFGEAVQPTENKVCT